MDVFLDNIVIPLWFLVASVLSGVIIGTGMLLIALGIIGRARNAPKQDADRAREPSREKLQEKPVGQSRAKSHEKSQKDAPVAPSALPPDKANELAHRAKLGGGFLVKDAGDLLGITQGKVLDMIRAGKLVKYSDQTGRTWVTAVSLAAAISPPPVSHEVPVVGKPVAVIPVAPALAQAPASIPIPVVPVVTVSQVVKRTMPIRQFYWYRADGSDTKYATLAEVLSAIGYNGKIKEWSKLPDDVKARIQREKV